MARNSDTTKLKVIMALAEEEARRLGNVRISPEHLFLGIMRLENDWAMDLLLGMGMEFDEVKAKLEKKVSKNAISQEELPQELDFTLAASSILRRVMDEAWQLGDQDLEAEHLILAVLRNQAGFVTKLLGGMGINYDNFKELLLQEKNRMQSDDRDEGRDEEEGEVEEDDNDNYYDAYRPPVMPGKQSKTPTLDNCGRDITRAAEEGLLDPVIGREQEIERLAQILSRRKKNNPVLLGEPGVGKSAIAEGLALRIVQKKVPRLLLDKRVVALDLASVVAGTKYRGQFEERIKLILKELTQNKNVILFIDEIHTIVGAGSSGGSLDAANMLKPALARGEIQCIGATTLDEYRENIEKDGALERRFQKVLVEPTTSQETIEILTNIKSRYEDHHNVRYTDGAIEACVKLTMRYVSDRALPDKAIDAMDEAGARAHILNIAVPSVIENLENEIELVRNKKKEAVHLQNFEVAAAFRDQERQLQDRLEQAKTDWQHDLDEHRIVVDAEKVAEVVAMMTGVPVKRIAQTEGAKLLQMRDELAGSVVGQEEAIEKIVKAIHRNRAGLKDPNRPIGSFIFLGPTGVGKTQLAKVLAKYLFDTQDALIRIDMSEYMEKYAVSRLVGAPPGYVGYEEGGQLTEKVRRKPYSVVLLDEIEKAHPDVFNILLQLLDDGQLTDSLGRKVDFKNTIVIMTSNIGSRQLKDFGSGIGFLAAERSEDVEYARGVVQKALKNTFSPEFLNRIDDVIVFNSLNKDDLHTIVDIELKGLLNRVEDLGFHLEVTSKAKDFLTDKGYEPQYGARPLKRSIQKYLEDELAEIIIKGDDLNGKVLEVDCENGDKLTIREKR